MKISCQHSCTAQDIDSGSYRVEPVRPMKDPEKPAEPLECRLRKHEPKLANMQEIDLARDRMIAEVDLFKALKKERAEMAKRIAESCQKLKAAILTYKELTKTGRAWIPIASSTCCQVPSSVAFSSARRRRSAAVMRSPSSWLSRPFLSPMF